MLIYSFRSGNFEISIYNSLSKEIVTKWDEMKSESLNSSYLIFIEESKPLDLSFRYVLIEKVIEKNKETCAIIYFQLLKFTNKNIRFHKSFLLSVLTGIILKLRPFYFLICGNSFAVNFPAISFIDDKINRDQIIGILTEIDTREKSDVFILKDLDDEFTPSMMAKYDLSPYSFDLTMSLKIDSSWNSLEDYIQSLTKKYKKRAERIIMAGDKMILKDLNAEEIRHESSQVKLLFNQVSNKQTIKMGLIDEKYFYEFKRRFPSEFSFIGYYLEDKMIAFSTFIEHGNTLEIHYIGINYLFNKDLMIYFNILMGGVERAILKKKEHLELGRTAREAKANIGGKPVYFNDYINIKGWFAKILTKKFTGYFNSELGEDWQDRHPFKK